VNLAATATDPGGAVQRVEFRVGATLVGTDTTSPYTATATGLTAGSFTATATAFDNGTPALSASQSVTFNIGGGTNTLPTVNLTAPTSGQVFPSGTSVNLAATATDPGGAVTRRIPRRDHAGQPHAAYTATVTD
jgi:hypothetical protein